MVTQLPPMRIEYQTQQFNKDYHKIVEPQGVQSDKEYMGKEVYYLWPGLLDGGGRIISRGRVAIHKVSH